MSSLRVCVPLLALSLLTATAHGQSTEQPGEGHSPPEEHRTEALELAWPDGARRVHPAEAVAAPLVVGLAFTLYLAPPSPPTDGRSITRFDRRLQERIQLDPGTGRDVVALIGDVGFLGSFVYRAFDDIVMAGAVRGSWDVSWQLAVIDAIAFGMVGSVTWAAQALYGRQRPEYTFCEEENGATDPRCEGGDRTNRSLISGHLATAVAGASLTCLHHGRMRIYGNQRRGRSACVSHTLVAVTVGVSRLMAGSHWPTDIFSGTALGLLAGWVVPRLVHYGWDEFGFGQGQWDEDDRGSRASPPLRIAVAPQVSSRGAGLAAIGMW